METLEERTVEYIWRNGEKQEKKELILKEHQIDVYVNERLTMKLVCTPSALEELVLGRLLTEGFIKDIDELEMCYICDTGHRARVYVKNDLTGVIGERSVLVPTCCTDNQISQIKKEWSLQKKLSSAEWKEDWIFKCADCFAKDTHLHRSTFGTHSCILAVRGEILFLAEDIGRHNALDKAIGWALKHGISLSDCMLYTSGRVPADMVRKAIVAGIAVLVSKTAPTLSAVELAEQYGLSLVGSARSDYIKVYTDFRE